MCDQRMVYKRAIHSSMQVTESKTLRVYLQLDAKVFVFSSCIKEHEVYLQTHKKIWNAPQDLGCKYNVYNTTQYVQI